MKILMLIFGIVSITTAALLIIKLKAKRVFNLILLIVIGLFAILASLVLDKENSNFIEVEALITKPCSLDGKFLDSNYKAYILEYNHNGEKKICFPFPDKIADTINIDKLPLHINIFISNTDQSLVRLTN